MTNIWMYEMGSVLQIFEKENTVYWRTWKSLPNVTYLDSVIHGVRYNNVPLAGHGYTTGKLEMTVSTSGRAKQEAEVAVHAKNLPYKHRTNIPEQILTTNLKQYIDTGVHLLPLHEQNIWKI